VHIEIYNSVTFHLIQQYINNFIVSISTLFYIGKSFFKRTTPFVSKIKQSCFEVRYFKISDTIVFDFYIRVFSIVTVTWSCTINSRYILNKMLFELRILYSCCNSFKLIYMVKIAYASIIILCNNSLYRFRYLRKLLCIITIPLFRPTFFVNNWK